MIESTAMIDNRAEQQGLSEVSPEKKPEIWVLPRPLRRALGVTGVALFVGTAIFTGTIMQSGGSVDAQVADTATSTTTATRIPSGTPTPRSVNTATIIPTTTSGSDRSDTLNISGTATVEAILTNAQATEITHRRASNTRQAIMNQQSEELSRLKSSPTSTPRPALRPLTEREKRQTRFPTTVAEDALTAVASEAKTAVAFDTVVAQREKEDNERKTPVVTTSVPVDKGSTDWGTAVAIAGLFGVFTIGALAHRLLGRRPQPPAGP